MLIRKSHSQKAGGKGKKGKREKGKEGNFSRDAAPAYRE
jgi:hypothetical protein